MEALGDPSTNTSGSFREMSLSTGPSGNSRHTHQQQPFKKSNTPNRYLQTVRCCNNTTRFRTPTCRAEQSVVAQCLLGSLCLETMKDEKRTKDTVN